MYYLRKEIGPVLERLGKRYHVIAPVNRVPIEEYYLEMQSSRICISPFGYGEICWRDFEAMLCGCLSLSQTWAMLRLVLIYLSPTRPMFQSNGTYADLEEKCSYYLEHDGERQRIVDQAFEVLHSFYQGDGIMKAALAFTQQVGTLGTAVVSSQL